MKGTIIDFMQLLVDKPELARELEELAARFDFEFTDEVSDEELDEVAGGLTTGGQLSVNEPVPSEPTPEELLAGQTAAPFISGGAVLSAAVSCLGQLKDRSGA